MKSSALPTLPNRGRLLPALVLLAAVSPAAARAQAPVRGIEITVTVRADSGKTPLPGAQVEMMGTGRIASADGQGVVRLRGVPPGPALFEVRRLGYAAEHFTLVIPQTDTVGIDVDMLAAPVRLAGIRATSTWTDRSLREAGFYQRRRSGIGSYAIRSEWKGRGYLGLSDVVRRMRGIRIARTQDGRTVLLPSRGSTSLNLGCTADVYVDGVNANLDPGSDDVDQRILFSEVEAVETYAGPSEIPSEYNPTGRVCAVVLVWTHAQP